jgi:hypothetical protein
MEVDLKPSQELVEELQALSQDGMIPGQCLGMQEIDAANCWQLWSSLARPCSLPV